MQVFCKATNSAGDIRCKICGQAFELEFARATAQERADARYIIQMALRDQHLGTDDREAHPEEALTVSAPGGDLKFTAATLFGKMPDWAF